MKVVYYSWLAVTGIISFYVLAVHFPSYVENEHPLFTDLFTAIVYMPCFFILLAAIPSQIAISFIREPRKHVLWSFVFHLVACMVVQFIFSFSVVVSLILIAIALAASAIYMAVSYLIFSLLKLCYNHKVVL